MYVTLQRPGDSPSSELSQRQVSGLQFIIKSYFHRQQRNRAPPIRVEGRRCYWQVKLHAVRSNGYTFAVGLLSSEIASAMEQMMCAGALTLSYSLGLNPEN